MAQPISKVLYLTVRSIELYRIKYELLLDKKRIKTEYTFNCGRPIQNHQSLFAQLRVGHTYRVVTLLVQGEPNDRKWCWTWPNIQEVDPTTVNPKNDPEFVSQIPYYYTPEGKQMLAKAKIEAKERKAQAEFDRALVGPMLPKKSLLDILDV